MINYDQEIYDGGIAGGATPALAKLMTAQARHETGNYNNYQTKQNFNVFGMKYSVNSRYAQPGNISPEKNAYAHYPSLQYAILDYIDRYMGQPSKNGGTKLQEFNTVQDGDTTTFATKLKSYGYFGATLSEYISGLNTALKRMSIVAFYFKYQKTINYTLIGGVIIALTGYVYYLKKKKVF